jgi:alpha-N-arabinofuranosidase
VYSGHVKNPAYYPRSWSEDDYFGPRTFYPAADIERADGVPFPWEPVGDDGVGLDEAVVDGVPLLNGRSSEPQNTESDE